MKKTVIVFLTCTLMICMAGVVNADSIHLTSGSIPSWSPDGTHLVFVKRHDSNNKDIFTINIDGSELLQITHMPLTPVYGWYRNAWGPTYRPNSDEIYYMDNSPSGADYWWICKTSIDGVTGRNPIKMVPGGDTFTPMKFSPDGSQFVYKHYKRYGTDGIMISNHDGTGTYPVLLYEGLGGVTWGSNNKLAYTKVVDGVWSIYTINIDGTEETRITDESFGNLSSWINWSPDGQTLLFPYNNDIWVIGIDGNGLTQITDDESADTYAVFSPDGLTIAYTSVREGQEEVFVMDYNAGPVSNPPIANAGENIIIATEEMNATEIQGTATDADPDDILEYRWLEGEAVLMDWMPVGESGECHLDLSGISIGVGTHTLILEVTDGQATSSDDMILTIKNSAPHAAPTGGGVYEVNTDVTLSGNVSDYDGDQIEYQWKEGTDVLDYGTIQAIAGGAPVQLSSYVISNLSLGSHTIVLEVTDNINPEPISSEVSVEIVDNTVPTLSPVPNQSILWPPNHKMVDIIIAANAADNSGLPVTLSATVVSNEPEEGLGDGDESPDWTEPAIDQDTGIINVNLRAERSGSGEGRVYTLTITATDELNNTSTADVDIIVPHDKGKK